MRFEAGRFFGRAFEPYDLSGVACIPTKFTACGIRSLASKGRDNRECLGRPLSTVGYPATALVRAQRTMWWDGILVRGSVKNGDSNCLALTRVSWRRTGPGDRVVRCPLRRVSFELD